MERSIPCWYRGLSQNLSDLVLLKGLKPLNGVDKYFFYTVGSNALGLPV